MLLLVCVFACVAYFSSSVGLGGGSSYTALMAVSGIPLAAVPLVALSLNLVVTTAGSYHFIRRRHAEWRLIAPFLITSMPMAYLGGSLHLPRTWFYALLMVSLAVVVARIFFYRSASFGWSPGRWRALAISLAAGAVLGFVAGVVGIGGGIYLVPLILVLGLGTEKQAAASGAVFIWLNSIVGLGARLRSHSVELADYAPLVAAVAVGGLAGSYLGATTMKPATMQKILGWVIVVALCLLVWKLADGSA